MKFLEQNIEKIFQDIIIDTNVLDKTKKAGQQNQK